MNMKPKSILCFDNYPEAKLALGKVIYPIVVKPYGCNDDICCFDAKDYGEAIQVLYDAFEYTKNGWIAIESY